MKLALLCLALLLLMPPAAQAQKANSYQDFLDEAIANFLPASIRLAQEYNLASYSWWLEQGTGKLTFSDRGTPKVIASVQIVGSYSTSSHTWKWAWANDTVVEELKKGAQQVKQYGEEKGFSELTTAKWACPADYAGTLTAAAGYILKAKGAYRGPIEDGYVYLLITDIKKVDEKH